MLRGGQLPAQPKIQQGWADSRGLPGPCTGTQKQHELGWVRPRRLSGFLALCREVVAVAVALVVLVVAAVAMRGQACPLQAAALPSTPGCMLAEPLSHLFPHCMQLDCPSLSNLPWSSLKPQGHQAPMKSTGTLARGGTHWQHFHLRTGRVVPGAGRASVYHAGLCSSTTSPLRGRLPGSRAPHACPLPSGHDGHPSPRAWGWPTPGGSAGGRCPRCGKCQPARASHR